MRRVISSTHQLVDTNRSSRWHSSFGLQLWRPRMVASAFGANGDDFEMPLTRNEKMHSTNREFLIESFRR